MGTASHGCMGVLRAGQLSEEGGATASTHAAGPTGQRRELLVGGGGLRARVRGGRVTALLDGGTTIL